MSKEIFNVIADMDDKGLISMKMALNTNAPNATLVAAMIVESLCKQLAAGTTEDRPPQEQGYSAATLLMGIQQMALARILDSLVRKQNPDFAFPAAQGVMNAMKDRQNFWENFNQMVTEAQPKQ